MVVLFPYSEYCTVQGGHRRLKQLRHASRRLGIGSENPTIIDVNRQSFALCKFVFVQCQSDRFGTMATDALTLGLLCPSHGIGLVRLTPAIRFEHVSACNSTPMS